MSGDMIGCYPYSNDHHDGKERDSFGKKEKRERRQPEHNDSRKDNGKDVYDELLEIIKKKDQEIEMLKNKFRRLFEEKEDTDRRSRQLTSEMAKIMDMKSTFENTDDEYANSKLAEKFQKLYSNDWVRLSRWLATSFPTITELQIIQYLTNLMKNVYQECLKIADFQIRRFLFLDRTEEADITYKQRQELFSLRRNLARNETIRTKIKQVVNDNLEPNDCFFKGENEDTAKVELKFFLNKYLDCCWLMIVSNPPMSLNFEVIGKPHRNYMEQFSVYSLKTPVDDMTKEEGSVYEVVWPSVCLQDRLLYYQKGDVVIVRNGLKPEHKDCLCCTYQNHYKAETHF